MNQIDAWENEDLEEEKVRDITRTNEFSTEVVRKLCSESVSDAVFVTDSVWGMLHYGCVYCNGTVSLLKKESLHIGEFPHDDDCYIRTVKDLMTGIAEWSDVIGEFVYLPGKDD